MNCMENDMEQNEQIEDNGFEKFEDQDKYISIGKKIVIRGDRFLSGWGQPGLFHL